MILDRRQFLTFAVALAAMPYCVSAKDVVGLAPDEVIIPVMVPSDNVWVLRKVKCSDPAHVRHLYSRPKRSRELIADLERCIERPVTQSVSSWPSF